MSGYLLRNIADGEWKSQYVDLREGKLAVREERDADPSAILLLQGMTIALHATEPHSFRVTSCFSSGVPNGYIILKAGSHNEMMDWASALYYGIAILNGGGYILALEILAQQSNTSRKEVVAETIARLTQQEIIRQTDLTAEEVRQLEEELIEGLLQDESRQGIEAEGRDDTDAQIRNNVASLLDDMLVVLEHRSLEAEEPGKSRESFTSNDIVVASPRTDSDDMHQAPVTTAPSPSVTPSKDGSMHQRSSVLRSSTQFAPVVVFRQPRIVFEMIEDDYDDDHGPAVSPEDVRGVFLAHAKVGGDGKRYINVMQFSGLWRRASGQKGNLFKEMQMFNNR